ncbi:diguanylate cyclase/phosphodiesterase (GGDEF & EAL domains) with PAS/PAC sensor(s) [Methylophaga frappieri]|uniref:Sensor protein FixL n=1 Tax=Methylophaga frappieri (strain ATCC BAA-2434 / DSM 25690 / JAM7) TaxID=754477 RepID=I1YIB4_METFJ|nr:ABC transporter substrate-binding protein [Methylophaga frappieri]AFJ02657.1 diguanylate cyclase/phosphodiesterase (GGDEF & EAL domains) with PAS/PAC sensor(s) [Methylophaga frappieri]
MSCYRRFLLCLLLVLPGSLLAVEESRTLTPVTVKLHWLHQFQFAGIYAAIEAGYYRDAGLNVTIETAWEPPHDEVESGEVEFGFSGAGLVVERLNGRPFVALAAIFQRSPYTWLVLAESSIEEPTDFIGKTVTRHSSVDDLSAILWQQNIDTTKINFVPRQPNDLQRLIAGEIDILPAYVSNEPYYLEQRNIAYRAISPHDFDINFYSDILFTSEQFLRESPEIVAAFHRATLQGWEDALNYPDAVIDTILRNYNTQQKTRAHLYYEANALKSLSLYPMVEIGHMTLARWQAIADYYQKQGVVNNSQPLAGFLYEPPSERDVTAWQWGLLLLALIAIMALLGFHLKRRHSLLLKSQVAEKTAALAQELQHRKTLENYAKREGERLKTVLDNTQDGVITIDASGKISHFNQAASTLFGYQPDDVIGKNITMLMPATFRHQHEQGMLRFLQHGESNVIGSAVQVEALHKSGQTIPIELTLSAYQWESQYFFTGIARDISLRQAEHQALITAKEEAEKANQAKSEFLSAMSHELRTPLNAIMGFAQLLKMDIQNQLSAEQSSHLDIILQSGSHLAKLINDVLELSRIESGNLDVTLVPVNVSQVIEDCLPFLQTLAHDNSIQIDIPPATNHWVKADATRLKQVMINLLSNAIKYNRPQGMVSISLDELSDNQILRITITDTGIGIPKQLQTRLFTAFDRLGQDASGIEGSGVGLVVTQRLIEAMQGRIGFDSREGEGSRFWLDLALMQTKMTPSPAPVDTESLPEIQSSQSVPGGKTMTVLYVEDNPANIQLMQAYFRQHSHCVMHSCKTAETALQAITTLKPELILIDINLPGMNGLEATRQIRQMPGMKPVPIVAITAAAMPHEQQRASGLFDAYLTKPLNFNELDIFLQNNLSP